jgi:PAS domain S-box-containing protein
MDRLEPSTGEGMSEDVAAGRSNTAPRSLDSQFRSLFEAAPDAILIVDRNGRIILVNEQTEQLFGYHRLELHGQLVEILVPERFRQQHVAQRDGYIAAPRTRPMGSGLALCGVRKDGTEVPVEISLSPLEGASGGQVIAVVRDVTDRRHAEEELKRTAAELAESNERLQRLTAELSRSNDELGQFTYVASHDLQEPLRMVSSYTQLLARRYKGKLDQDADEFIAYAVDGANRMQRLIEDLLSYARVGSHGRDVQPVDLDVVAQRVLDDLQPALKESGGAVHVGKLPVVLGDASSLTQLFQNLIGNALKYRGEEAPEIHVEATPRNSHWELSIQDNGIGFDQEYAEQLFVMFKRLHPRERYDGTGIGLAICKKIVERHGGQIWAESAPGEGARFVFTLPAHSGT